MAMSSTEAQSEIEFLNAQAVELDPIDMAVRLINKGLSQDVVTHLIKLCDHVKIIAGKVIQIGKIVLMKIWEFIQANPDLTIGIAVGAALCALTHMVPWIGPKITPIVTALGAAFGAVAGYRLDKKGQGKVFDSGVFGIAADIITLAKKFLKLFSSILIAVTEYVMGTNS